MLIDFGGAKSQPITREKHMLPHNGRLFAPTIALLLSSTLALAVEPKQVHSLDQLPAAFKSKDGRAKFREQISGVPMADGFGTTLPVGLTVSAVAQLVAPGRDAALATLVGVKPWPYRANTFVAIVCLAANKAAHDDDLKYNQGHPTCAAKEVHLAMLEYQATDQLPKRIASYGKALDIMTSWERSSMLPPVSADDKPTLPGDYLRFDFAPFKISPTETAFGIRVGWSQSYSGGGADSQALMLFALDGDRLINILSVPIYYSENLAGDWHKDGTRDHSLSEDEGIVTFLAKKTNGHFDLQLKGKREKWKQVFVWDDQAKRYQPESQ